MDPQKNKKSKKPTKLKTTLPKKKPFAKNSSDDSGEAINISTIFTNVDESGFANHLDGADEGEVKLQSTEGVSIEKADRSLSELHRWYKSGKLIIDPEWQRSYVWDGQRASKLVESFLMDIPIPVVYLSKTEDGKYEV